MTDEQMAEFRAWTRDGFPQETSDQWAAAGVHLLADGGPRVYNKWTGTELEVLDRLRSEGLSRAEIAHRLGRSVDSVRGGIDYKRRSK
jgi:DNA-binding NarL/FixJ family response regulator